MLSVTADALPASRLTATCQHQTELWLQGCCSWRCSGALAEDWHRRVSVPSTRLNSMNHLDLFSGVPHDNLFADLVRMDYVPCHLRMRTAVGKICAKLFYAVLHAARCCMAGFQVGDGLVLV